MSKDENPAPSSHLRGDEPQSETADPDRVYFQFVRGDAFGQDENRLRIRKWDTKPFDGASEYVFQAASHATSAREAARQEAIRLIERAGLEMEEEYDLLVDDISETMLRFAAVPSPSPSPNLVAPLDRLEEIAKAQKAYHDRKQHEFPSVDDFLDEEGELHLPADIGPLLSQSSYNGRYSEADWWISTIQKVKAEFGPSPQEQKRGSNDGE
jgi:hypothetical protein